MQDFKKVQITHSRISPQDIVPNQKEVLRYLGYKVNSVVDQSVLDLVNSSIEQLGSLIKPQGVYAIYDLEISEDENVPKIKFADVEFYSKDLARNLKGCKKIALLAATVGPLVDGAIKKFTKIDTAKAAVFQACGAMYIEEFVDMLNAQIKNDVIAMGRAGTKLRYSPGFGDVSLELQKEFFRLLPCTQRLGLTLMDSNIMAPEKSVTAFVGIL